MSRIERMRLIVEEWQASTVEGTLVDANSANAYITVYDALNQANREKLESMSLSRAIHVVWALLTR